MIDCISRGAVLTIFAERCDAVRPYHEAWQAVEQLPSVTPERPKGRKIRREVVFGWDIFNCSECGEEIGLSYNFCPCCGADMREVQDGNI